MADWIESPFLRPVQLMVKPAGSACNLACRYCYYIDRTPARLMDYETLEEVIRSHIEASPIEEVTFIWHGGEPLLCGLPFFRRAVELQRRYAASHTVYNTLQTNGTLLTSEWCRFFADHDFFLGLSIDGPSPVHDAYRRDRRGAATHARVEKAAHMLNEHGVEWNAMAVVNNLNMADPDGFYSYFRDRLRCRYIQFAPIVERAEEGRLMDADVQGGRMTDHSVTPEGWGRFLCRLFDLWVRRDVGDVFIQLFDAVLANRAGVSPGVCTLARECGGSPVVESNGDVYLCDHFVTPRHLLGNIRNTPLAALLNDGRLRDFGDAKSLTLPAQCLACHHQRVCHGECPKNRILPGGLNYLCKGYHAFFTHTEPLFTRMLELWQQGLPASDIIKNADYP